MPQKKPLTPLHCLAYHQTPTCLSESLRVLFLSASTHLAAITQDLDIQGEACSNQLRISSTGTAAQEVAFFDLPENASGAQSTRLAEDTAAIRGAVGDQLGAVAQSLTTFVAGAWPVLYLLLCCKEQGRLCFVRHTKPGCS